MATFLAASSAVYPAPLYFCSHWPKLWVPARGKTPGCCPQQAQAQHGDQPANQGSNGGARLRPGWGHFLPAMCSPSTGSLLSKKNREAALVTDLGPRRQGRCWGAQQYLVGDIIHHDDAVGPPVVAGSDGPEALLPSCVPLHGGSGRGRSARVSCALALPRQSGRPPLTIWSLMVLPSSSMVRILKSTPMVLM